MLAEEHDQETDHCFEHFPEKLALVLRFPTSFASYPGNIPLAAPSWFPSAHMFGRPIDFDPQDHYTLCVCACACFLFPPSDSPRCPRRPPSVTLPSDINFFRSKALYYSHSVIPFLVMNINISLLETEITRPSASVCFSYWIFFLLPKCIALTVNVFMPVMHTFYDCPA